LRNNRRHLFLDKNHYK